MRRRLLNLATALSLLLFAAVVIVWVISALAPRSHVWTRDQPLFGEMRNGAVYYELRWDGNGVSATVLRANRQENTFPWLDWLQGPGAVLPPREFTLPASPSGLDLGVVAVTSGNVSMLMGYDFVGPVVWHPPYRRVEIRYVFLALLALVVPVIRVLARARNESLRKQALQPTAH